MPFANAASNNIWLQIAIVNNTFSTIKRHIVMIVQITESKFTRDRILDYDSEEINQVYYKYIKLRYDFVTQKGYSGYIESPRLWINFFMANNNIVQEYLDQSDANIWYTLIDPNPYMSWTEDEDGYKHYARQFNGKYFYKTRFQNNTWVRISFNDIVIKQLAPSLDTDPFNIKSFLICPWKVYDISPIEIENPIKKPDYDDGLPF
jgi:hypothetical protein